MLAGVPQTALHLSKRQFFSCLKLISAYQAKIPLCEELIFNMVSLPLPKFNWNDGESPPPGHRSGQRQWVEVQSPDLIELANKESTVDLNSSEQPSTDSEIEQSDKREGRGSPEAWSTASDSPTPTNSVAVDRPWAKGNIWLSSGYEEQRQLLGTEEESSDRHSSDEEYDIDLEAVYQVTPEQKEYYIKQFSAIQPDMGLLPGHVAK